MSENVIEYVTKVIAPAIRNSQLAYSLVDEISGRCQHEYVLKSGKSHEKKYEVCMITAMFVTHTPKYQGNFIKAKRFDIDICPERIWKIMGFKDVYYMAEDGDWSHISRLIVNLNDLENLMAEEIAEEIQKFTETTDVLSWNPY